MAKVAHCVICYYRPATRVVLLSIGDSRWSRLMCDECQPVAGAVVHSDKQITR